MSTTPILQIKGLTRHFGGLTAVNRLDFSVNKGELIGLIGPNGAGKTTLFNLLVGLSKPSAGEVFFDGRIITGKKTHQIAKLGMVKTFQNVSLFPEIGRAHV